MKCAREQALTGTIRKRLRISISYGRYTVTVKIITSKELETKVNKQETRGTVHLRFILLRR